MLYNLFENRDFVSVFAVALLAEGVDRNNISLKFSAEDRDVLKEYIKDNGKEDLVAVIVQKIRGEI